MDYTDLLAKQRVLADIYNRQSREYKLKKNREEKARAKALKEFHNHVKEGIKIQPFKG
jgi:hypothetical protein